MDHGCLDLTPAKQQELFLLPDVWLSVSCFLMLRPISRGVVPPGGLVRYRDPDTGWEYAHPYYVHVKAVAREYRVKAGLSVPYDWDEFFDKAMCAATPRACQDFPDGVQESAPSFLQMAANFTRSMMSWAGSGFKVVSYEEFKARYSICSGAPATETEPGKPQCEYFGTFSGFGLTRCRKCGCSSLKLYIKNSTCPINKW